MRNLIYELANGDIVTSLALAQASGQSFVAKCVPVASSEPPLTEKQRAKRISLR